MTFVGNFADKIENFVIDSEVVDGTHREWDVVYLVLQRKKCLIIQ